MPGGDEFYKIRLGGPGTVAEPDGGRPDTPAALRARREVVAAQRAALDELVDANCVSRAAAREFAEELDREERALS